MAYGTFKGRLVIDRESGGEWGKLVVNDEIRQKCFDLLGLDMIGFDLPDYEAHISAFDRSEVRRIPKDFWFEGRSCDFRLSHLRVVDPEHWDEVRSCVILCVRCKPLERLRKALGFPPLMYGDHEFHITIGVKDGKIDGCIENVVRLFNEYLRDDFGEALRGLDANCAAGGK